MVGAVVLTHSFVGRELIATAEYLLGKMEGIVAVSLAPSSAHVKIFCLSVSAYHECPNYKLKTRNWREENWWERFLKQISYSFLQRRKERKDGMPRV